MGCKSTTDQKFNESSIMINISENQSKNYDNFKFCTNIFQNEVQNFEKKDKQRQEKLFDLLLKANLAIASCLFEDDIKYFTKEQAIQYIEELELSEQDQKIIFNLSPIKLSENKDNYQFIHPYIYECLLIKGIMDDLEFTSTKDNHTILKEIEDGHFIPVLGKNLLNSEKNITKMCCQHLTQKNQMNEEFDIREILVQMVQLSQFQIPQNPEIDQNIVNLSANALTILNQCEISLSYINFTNTRIRGAILNDTMIQNSQFDFADLQDVQLKNTNLDFSTFINTKMHNVEFGMDELANNQTQNQQFSFNSCIFENVEGLNQEVQNFLQANGAVLKDCPIHQK